MTRLEASAAAVLKPQPSLRTRSHGHFLAGGGAIGERMRAFDWSATSLGPTETWPQSLRAALSICLHSSLPTAIYWGPELRLLYNDAWAPIPADRHPWALGRAAREVWADIWHVIEPQLAGVLASGEGFSAYDQMLPMERAGRTKETYWNYSFTPIHDEDGRVAGVLNQGHETTSRVLEERRRAVLLQLAERSRELHEPEAIAGEAARVLADGLAVSRVGFGEIDDARDRVSVKGESSDGELVSLAGEWRVIDGFGSEIMAELRAGRTLRIDDTARDPRTAGPGPTAAFADLGARSVLIVPLMRRGHLKAAFYVHEPRPHRWTTAEAALAKEVAERTWDTMERARAEAALRAAEERLRLMADALPGLICYVDVEQRYQFNNKAYETWFGQSRRAMHGRHVRDVIGEAAYRKLEPYVVAALAGEHLTFENVVPYRDGGSRHVTGEYIPSRKADGAIDGYYAFVQDITARKQAELALAESEARFRTLADGIPTLCWMANADGWIYWYNRRWYDYTGKTSEEMEGWGWQSVHDPELLPAILERWRSSIATGEPFEMTFPLRAADGSFRSFLTRIRPVRGDDGRITRWFGVNTDISEQVAAAAALRESEERFRNWADSAPVMVWVTEADGRCSFLSRSWYEFTGKSPGAGLGFGWLNAVHPDDAERAGDIFRAASAAHEAFRLEYRLRHASGDYRWAIDAAAPRFSRSGAFLGFVGSVIDITERKVAEEALRTSEAQFRELADNTPQIVWASTPGVGNDYLNRRWYEFTGAPAGEVGSQSWLPYLHPDDAGHVLAAWQHSLATGEPLEVEHRFLEAKSGRYRWQLGRALPIRDGSGRVTRWLGTCTDIDDQKHAEESLRELNETLERRVAERTAELAAANRHLTTEIEERRRAEAALTQAQKIEAVGQLTAGVAHDFNNLLTVIAGNLTFLGRDVAGNARAERRVAHMRIAAERGAKLTTQLLAFSRNQRLAPRAVALNEIVTGMGDLLRATIGGAVDIEMALHPALMPAMVDPTQIELAILNLSINARDAMEGGGTLTVETANVIAGLPTRPEEPPQGEYVMVAVADTGSGMPPEVLAKAFEPFFTTKQIGKGSGLGLAQVAGLARQSGGGVRIMTEPGSGTRAEIYLPRATAPMPVVAPPEHAAAQPRGDATVLLVDDDDEVRAVTGESLGELGYRVIEAGSGARALDLLEHEAARVDVVVLDYAMPGMNGAEVARRIAERRPDLPIVFVTGYAERSALEGLAPHAAVVQKPFRPSELAATVQAVLGPRVDAAVEPRPKT